LLFYYSTPTDLTLRAGLVKYQAGGDFDGDGDVDSTDFNHPTLGFKARFGVNLDGRDFLTWQRNYGTPAPGVAAGTGVPEPATGSLFAGAVAMALSRLRASRRRRSGGGRGGRL
jgi:hypothetical protein